MALARPPYKSPPEPFWPLAVPTFHPLTVYPIRPENQPITLCASMVTFVTTELQKILNQPGHLSQGDAMKAKRLYGSEFFNLPISV
jgi:hypothetical protein